MMRYSWTLILCFLLAPVWVLAAPFNPEQANKTLDRLNIKLSTEQLNVVHLKDAVDVIDKLQEDAKLCVRESQKELVEVDRQLKITSAAEAKEEQQFLQRKKSQLETQLSSCRLFVLRSQEVVEAFSETIRKFVTSQIFEREPAFWQNIAAYPNVIGDFFKNFKTEVFVENTGVSHLNLSFVVAICGLLLLGLIVGFRWSYAIKRHLDLTPAEEMSSLVKQSTLGVLAQYAPVLMSLMFVIVLFNIRTVVIGNSDFIKSVCYALMIYIAYIMMARFLFYPPNIRKSIVTIPRKLAGLLINRLEILGILCLFGYLSFLSLKGQTLPREMVSIAFSTYILLISLALFAVLRVIYQLPVVQYKYPAIRVLLSVLIVVSLTTVIGAEMIGYHNLAVHILYGISFSSALTVIAWFIAKYSYALLTSLQQSGTAWQARLHYVLDLDADATLPELLSLTMTLYFMVWCTWLFLFLRSWGMTEAASGKFTDAIIDGFMVGDITIIPSRIVFSLIIFSVFVLLTRIMRAYFRRHARITKTKGGREAIATLIGYVGFGVSTVGALLIAGVNFTGIAIIAGALSVGIGFGLQGIVNNFVSGLILLLERPIRIGDRILVADIEGYVRSISIRSTRIQTLQKTDIIVPNAEIIGGQVTNMMWRDQNFRLEIKVGVAYGSDVECVRETLLEVATQHPEVVCDDESREPRVLFKGFGDSSLDFELWVIIKNVNLYNEIYSDMYFLVDKAFRDKKIEIAFPQRDLHIKHWPADKLKPESEDKNDKT